jgi:predicted kinase
MKISIPNLALVVLIGPSGSGKSTFARKHFLPTEVLSSDSYRAMVSDEENNQAVTNVAFEVLHFVTAKRLALGRLTVIDATNVQPEARKPLVALARQYHCLPVAIVLNISEKVCHERNRLRDERAFGPHVVRQQHAQLRRSLRGLGKEGFRHIFVLESPEEADAATVERVPLYNDKRDEHGPFDIIGDVHGCCDELEAWYAAVGAAGRASLPRAVFALEQAAARVVDNNKEQLEALIDEYRCREENVAKFVAAYRQYCWSVSSLTDLKLAPFHLLATEGRVHVDKSHVWHMEELAKTCCSDKELLLATPFKLVDVTDPASEAVGIEWWSKLTEGGGEGMVVKPTSFILRGNRGLAQPAVKCRGREYLRIIYGPDYTTEDNLARLRHRGLGQKRSLAMSEFALGIEGLERLARGEPLRRIHECVFGVLALECEPVDPRL